MFKNVLLTLDTLASVLNIHQNEVFHKILILMYEIHELYNFHLLSCLF